MSYLTLGGTSFPVTIDSASQKPVYIGSLSRAFDGTGRSNIQNTPKREWTVTLCEVTDALYASFLAAIAVTTTFTGLNGDIVGNVGTTVQVTVQNEVDRYSYAAGAATRLRDVTCLMQEM